MASVQEETLTKQWMSIAIYPLMFFSRPAADLVHAVQIRTLPLRQSLQSHPVLPDRAGWLVHPKA